MENVIELIEMLAAAIMFTFMVLITVSFTNQGIKTVYGIASLERDNTTIVENYRDDMLYATYVPVNKNGHKYYEGEVLGATVINEIKEFDSSVEIFIEANNLNALSYDGKPFLTYVRDYNDAPLKDAVIENRTYLRAYTYNADGSIYSVVYKFK